MSRFRLSSLTLQASSRGIFHRLPRAQSPIELLCRGFFGTILTLLLSGFITSPILAQREACTSWETQDSGINNPIHYLNAIAADDNGRMIVAGRDGFLESSDGIHWTIQDPVTSVFLHAVATSGSSWGAVGENGTILWSANGEAWTSAVTGTNATLYDLLWDGTKFVVVGYYLGPFSSTPAHIVMTSPTGENWTMVSQGSPYSFQSIAWNEDAQNPLYLAGDYRSIYTSPDLVTWTKHSLSNSPFGFVGDIGFFEGNFFAVASSYPETRVYESSDGTNWTTVFTAPRALSSLVIKKTGVLRYVLLGGDSDGVSYESSDLVTWEETAHDQRPNGGIWNETIHAFVAVGQAGSIISKHCIPCTFSVTTQPSSQAQGLTSTTFLAQGECGAEPYSFEWRDQNLTVQSTTATLVVPPQTETTRFFVTATDSEQSEQEKAVTVLVSQNPLLIDPNGDGQNTREDLSLVGSRWGTTDNEFDADGDGRMTNLDLQYVNTGSVGR